MTQELAVNTASEALKFDLEDFQSMMLVQAEKGVPIDLLLVTSLLLIYPEIKDLFAKHDVDVARLAAGIKEEQRQLRESKKRDDER